MAEVEVIRAQPEEPPVKEVILRLTRNEARAIRSMIGGSHTIQTIEMVNNSCDHMHDCDAYREVMRVFKVLENIEGLKGSLPE